MSCPPTFNFTSEIIIILGSLSFDWSIKIIFFIILFIRGVYSIYFYVFFNHGFSLTRLSYFFGIRVRENIIFIIHSIPLIFYFFYVAIF